jgi:hypothetical protein
MRLREWRTLADLFQQTKKYAESWDEYAEKLADYKKELEKAKKEGDTKKGEPKKEGAPAPAPSAKPEEAKPEEKRNGPPEGRPHFPRRRPGGSLIELLRDLTGQVDLGGPEDPDDKDEQGAKKGELSFKDGVSYADGPPQNGPPQPGQGADKKDEPKKPGRPQRNPQMEVLRQVLDGKVALDVYLEHAADVLDLLELAKQYKFDFFVTGGKEAQHVARELEAAGVAVVVVVPHDLASSELPTAAQLAAAGVDVVITTDGQTGSASRHLSLAAAAAVAGGMDKERALAAITSRAAALLGVADRVGTLEAGKDADVVVTSGELLSSSATVERVFVDGAMVVGR